MSEKNVSSYIKVVILACANAAVYGLPYMKGQFYDIMRDTLMLTHTQISMLFSIYGGISMVSYLLGGILADCVSVKKIMLMSLIISGILHIYVGTVPNYGTLCVIFGIFALTSVLAFYPASMKMLSCLNGGKEQGSAFGGYVAWVNIIGIIVVLIGLGVLTKNGNSVFVFKVMTGMYGLLHFATAILLVLFFPEEKEDYQRERMKWNKLPSLIKNIDVWCVVGIVFCNYMLQAVLTYAVPYFSYVYKLDDRSVLLISILRVNVITILVSPAAGKIADRCGSAVKIICYTFCLSAVLVIGVLASLWCSVPLVVVVVIVMLIMAVSVGGKSINMVAVSEIGIPKQYLGTIIGLVSFVGYSPDAFFYSLAGAALDKNEMEGYAFVFGCFLISAIVGALLCGVLQKRIK